MRFGAALGLCLAGAACTSAWGETAGPFTAAETERALAPVKQLQARCYTGSASQAARRMVRLEFSVYVDERGTLRSDPIAGDLRDPGLTECMRTGLDTLRFPAKGEADQLRLSFELGRSNAP